jgi:uridine kinase
MKSSMAVGIAGGTGAGKTTFARLLAGSLGEVVVLDMDSYYLDRSGVSPEVRDGLNFDEPGAFDIGLLMQHLSLLRQGDTIEKPRYSFESHTRIGIEAIAPAPVVLVEGLFALWWEDLRESFDLRIYLDAPDDVRLRRRIERDVVSRGRSPESVRRQYECTVQPMHEAYVAPTRQYADVVLASDRDISDCLMSVHSALKASRPVSR